MSNNEHDKMMSILTETSVSIARIESTQSAMNDKLESSNSILHSHNRILNGNGQPGMKTRLDRLEQSETRRVWVIRTLIGLSGTAFISVGGLLVRMMFFNS